MFEQPTLDVHCIVGSGLSIGCSRVCWSTVPDVRLCLVDSMSRMFGQGTEHNYSHIHDRKYMHCPCFLPCLLQILRVQKFSLSFQYFICEVFLAEIN